MLELTQAPVFIGNTSYRHQTLLYRHQVPELQAPVSIGNMCYRHRTSIYRHQVPELQASFCLEICASGTAPRLGFIKLLKEWGGVVPEVTQVVVRSIVVADHAHTVSVT